MPDGYVRITPDEGYVLVNTITEKKYSEAVVLGKDVHLFIAIEK